VRILIADDHELVRRGVRSVLRTRSDLEICGEAVDGKDAVEKAQHLSPDLIVMGVSMPNLNGIEATREIRRLLPRIDVLVLSQHNSPEVMRQALNAGARGYVIKATISENLLIGIEKVRVGELFFDASVSGNPGPNADMQEILQRSQAFERALRESEERFRLTFEQAAVGIAHVSKDGRWLRVNQKLCEILGYTQDELRKLTTRTVTHPADLAADLEQIAKLAGGELDQYSAEKRYIRKDGSSIWINNTVGAVRDSDPELSYLVSVVEDISARKESERSADLLAAIVNSSEDAIISKNLDGIITSWNAGARRLFGYSADEAVGQNITLIIPPERRSEEVEILSRLKRGERVDHFETVRVAKDGRLVDISLTISPVKDSSGRVVGASKVARDITDRKRFEIAVRESEAHLAAEAWALAKLNDWSSRLWRARGLEHGLPEILTGVMEILGSEKGTIRLLSPDGGVLSLVLQLGFEPEITEYIREVSLRANSPCARAARSGSPVMVEDTEMDPLLAPHRAAARAAGFRSIVSVPMITLEGQVIGVVSAYFASTHQPTEQELGRLDIYIRQAGDFIERSRTESLSGLSPKT
jgi:PAS domain S-box-containing protein